MVRFGFSTVLAKYVDRKRFKVVREEQTARVKAHHRFAPPPASQPGPAPQH